MNSASQHLIRVAMIGGGMAAMAIAARTLTNHEGLDYPVNPLGVNRSPYGEVFAMAMQGPIDAYWTQGELARLPPTVDPDPQAAACVVRDRPAESRPWNMRFRVFLEELDEVSTARTNPHIGSKQLDVHIRRQVENKLRFGYRLDPAHYGNYNSYHFFLSEPAVGTRRILTPAVAQLARETVIYCLAEEHDPRPALTAAAAATNIIHLMFADRQNEASAFTVAQMRETLALLDQCIARHIAVREKWIAAGHHQRLSPMRFNEMEDRFDFVLRIRDAAEPAVARFEREEAAALEPHEK